MLHHTGFLIIEDKKCHYLKKNTYIFMLCTAEVAELLGKGCRYLDCRKIKPHLRLPSAHPDTPVYLCNNCIILLHICKWLLPPLKDFFSVSLPQIVLKMQKGFLAFLITFSKKKRTFIQNSTFHKVAKTRERKLFWDFPLEILQ